MMVTQTPCLRRQIALIIKFKHVTEGYVRWSVARCAGREGIQSSCFANEPTTRITTSPSTNCSSAGSDAANVYAKTGT